MEILHGQAIYSSTEQYPALFADIQTEDYEKFKVALSHAGYILKLILTLIYLILGGTKYLKIPDTYGGNSESLSAHYTNIARKSPTHTNCSTSSNRSQKQKSELQRSVFFLILVQQFFLPLLSI